MKPVDGIILSCSGNKLKNDEIEFFKKTNPFGFVLFSRNFNNKTQITDLIKSLKEVTLNQNILIFVDQEGGRVQRFKSHEFIRFPPQKVFGDIYVKNKNLALDLAYKASYLLGVELNEIGVNVNFSPVCDLLFEDAHDVIGNRSFGKKPILVKELVAKFCQGFKDSGIISVPKHFPGHGRSKFDTHVNLSIIKTCYNELKSTDLVPFEILNQSLMVMLAHIIYPSLDLSVATYSKKIIRILKEEFNFKGLVLSDDISMKAIDDDLVTKVKKIYDAGCHVVLYCNGSLKEMERIYPFVKAINKNKFSYFNKEQVKIVFKQKKINKFKSDLLEYGLIENASKS